MPRACSSKPGVCVSRLRTVIGVSNERGMSKSRYSATSTSRSMSPVSTSCMTAVAVATFDTDPTRNSVLSGSTGLGSPAASAATSVVPYPRAVRISPSCTIETAAPAIPPYSMPAGSRPSSHASASALVRDAAAVGPRSADGPTTGGATDAAGAAQPASMSAATAPATKPPRRRRPRRAWPVSSGGASV